MSLVAGTAALPRLGPLAGRSRLSFNGSGMVRLLSTFFYYFLMIMSIHVDSCEFVIEHTWSTSLASQSPMRPLNLVICSTQTFHDFSWWDGAQNQCLQRDVMRHGLDSFRMFQNVSDVFWCFLMSVEVLKRSQQGGPSWRVPGSDLRLLRLLRPSLTFLIFIFSLGFFSGLGLWGNQGTQWSSV